MPAGRSFVIRLLCLSALLLGFLAARHYPGAFLLMGVLAPLPVLVAGELLEERGALTVALAAAVLVFCLHPGLGIIWDNLGFYSLLLLGALLSSLQARGVSAPQAIILAVAVLSVLALLVLLGEAAWLGLSPQALLARRTQEMMELVRQVLGAAGETAGPLVPGVSPEEVETVLQRLLPGLMVTNTAMVAWVNVIFSRQLSLALGRREGRPPLYHWAAPEWLIFVVLGAGFLLLVPVSGVRFLSLNLLLVLAVIYFFQGLAVVAAWFQRLRLPRVLRMISYPLMFLHPFCFAIITLGLMDLWLDFRRRHQPKDA